MARYNVTVPPTAEQGSYKTIARDTNGQTYRADALQDYNSCRAHDGLPPVSRMPSGTVYSRIRVKEYRENESGPFRLVLKRERVQL